MKMTGQYAVTCLMLALLLAGVGCGRGGGGTPTTEWKYDSGFPTTGWKQDFIDRGYAVLFSLPIYPMKLIWARFYIYSNSLAGPLEVHVWARDQVSDLISPFMVFASSNNAWLEVDIPDTVMTEDFYVGYLQTSLDGPCIGADQSAPSNHSYSIANGSFTQIYDADIMIRAIISQ